jgi:hypothetical protein
MVEPMDYSPAPTEALDHDVTIEVTKAIHLPSLIVHQLEAIYGQSVLWCEFL